MQNKAGLKLKCFNFQIRVMKITRGYSPRRLHQLLENLTKINARLVYQGPSFTFLYFRFALKCEPFDLKAGKNTRWPCSGLSVILI